MVIYILTIETPKWEETETEVYPFSTFEKAEALLLRLIHAWPGRYTVNPQHSYASSERGIEISIDPMELDDVSDFKDLEKEYTGTAI